MIGVHDWSDERLATLDEINGKEIVRLRERIAYLQDKVDAWRSQVANWTPTSHYSIAARTIYIRIARQTINRLKNDLVEAEGLQLEVNRERYNRSALRWYRKSHGIGK